MVLFIIIILVATIIVGFMATRMVHNIDEYLLARRRLLFDYKRISNSKPEPHKTFRKRKASSMRRWFFGYNLHVPLTTHGIPVEYIFLPGSRHDPGAFKQNIINRNWS